MQDPRAAAQFDGLKTDRRALHRIPEIGLAEYATQRYILDALGPLAPDKLSPMADTGVYALFRARGGTSPSPRTIAFRCDMDALAIHERTGCEYTSVHPGRMHACGHDGHMAALLALARIAAQAREDGALLDNVVLLFQPAEESDGGAQRMIEAGALDEPRVDEIYAMHLMPDVPMGKIGVLPGVLMASASEIDIEITGRAAHGATPQLGIDAVAAMAQLISLANAQFQRMLPPDEPVVMTIGRVEAGTVRNVVASSARLYMTLRTFTEAAHERALELLRAAMRAVDGAFGTMTALNMPVYYPPLVNDAQLANRLTETLGEDHYPLSPRMIAEDFSFFTRERPGVMVFTGCGTERFNAPLHADTFDFDERALVKALELYLSVIRFA